MTTVLHRRYVPWSHAHYAGSVVDGAYVLGLFGDAATELCVRTDGDEGLFASYDRVDFLSPVRAGDVLEVEATLVGRGNRSRQVSFEARVTCRSGNCSPGSPGSSGSVVLAEPLVVVRARGTVVVPG
jgi:3-aminobutyryl-CoA ammonia-lyase